MSLYERNYLNSNSAQESYGAQERAEGAVVSFVKQTYQLFASSLLAATVGAYIGLGMADTISSWYLGLVILEFALLFGLFFMKDKPGINLVLLFGFTFITGLTLTPLLSRTFSMPGGASIVANAFLLTTAIFGIMSIFALKTSRDLASMGKMLFIALIVVVISSIVNIFLGSPLLQVIIAGVGAILFSLYIAYDTQNIVRGLYDSPVIAAISLYLNFFNLFVSLLQLLGILGNSDE
ncbi:MAG: Bax inhibitor-1/YccA family protein [Wolinella sp.]